MGDLQSEFANVLEGHRRHIAFLSDLLGQKMVFAGVHVAIDKLQPAPGDVLVLRYEGNLTTAMGEEFTALAGFLHAHLGVTVLCLPAGRAIEHLNEDGMAAFGWVRKEGKVTG
jgi:hypothetical protein